MPHIPILQPAIADQEIEFDAREVAGVPTVDWAGVVTWPDTSGNANDGSEAGSTRYEEMGFGEGEQADVRFEKASQDHYTIPGVDLTGGGFTLFAVLEVIDISSHLAIIGSDGGGSPNARNINLFVKSDGSLILNREIASPYDVQSASGAIIAGNKYVISARYSSSTGVVIRVNGIEVGANAGATVAQVDWVAPSLGVTDDQSGGGVGRIFGDKRFVWASGYGSAATDAQIREMEGFLGARYGVTIVGSSAPKPAITRPEFEYDVNTLSVLVDGDEPSPWTDTSGEGNHATVDGGSPELEGAGWAGGIEDVRFKPASSYFEYSGRSFEDTDMTLFFVLQLWDMTSGTHPIHGSNSFVDRRMVEVYIETNGAITFSFGTNEGVLAVKSGVGEVAQGECFVLTCRFSQTDGKIIRVAKAGVPGTAGTQIAINAASRATIEFNFEPHLGDINGSVTPRGHKLAWYSANLIAASVSEMEQMETFLLETFCGQAAAPDPPPIWTPCNEGIVTSWTPCV